MLDTPFHPLHPLALCCVTNYMGGVLPKQLAEAVEKSPVMAQLVIPLENLPDAMKKPTGGYGLIYLNGYCATYFFPSLRWVI